MRGCSGNGDCCKLDDRPSWPYCGEIRLDVFGRPMLEGGGSVPVPSPGIGVKLSAFWNVPLPIPELPQTLPPFVVAAHCVNVSLFAIGDRPNGCGLRSPGEEYDDCGGLYGDG